MLEASCHLISKRTGIILFSLSLALNLNALCGMQDSIYQVLDEVTVKSQSLKLVKNLNDGAMYLNTLELGRHTKVLGEADVFNMIRLLPGVTANDDYKPGFSTNGLNNCHNLVEINKVPIIYPYHFGGIFSLVNPIFFKEVLFYKLIPNNSSSARLSGMIQAESPTLHPDHFSGNFGIGMTASSATAFIPLKKDLLSVALSCRVSYLNLFYRELLCDDKSKLSYNFYDTCASVIFTPNNKNLFKFSLIKNSDGLKYEDYEPKSILNFMWSNLASSLFWKNNTGLGPLEMTSWYTSYSSGFNFTFGESNCMMRYEVRQAGLKSELFTSSSENLGWSVGGDINCSLYTLPKCYVDHYISFNTGGSSNNIIESKVFGNCRIRLSDLWKMIGDCAIYYYHSDDLKSVEFSPSLTFQKTSMISSLEFSLCHRPQFINQVPLSEIGLASDYYIPSSKNTRVSTLSLLSIGWNNYINDNYWEIKTRIYGGWIKNEVYYTGSMMDLIDPEFDPLRKISVSDGFNTGAEISLFKNKGKFTGWITYSFDIAKRRYKESPDVWLPSVNEGLHTFKSLISWKINNHWQSGLTFNYRSGKCYTPINELFFIAGNIVMNYGERFSARLPDYHRLDLSLLYSFVSGSVNKLRHRLELSCLNVYGNKNIEFLTYIFDREKKEIRRKEVASLFRFLPSLSYSIEF